MVFNQHAATGDDVPRFGVEQANARYVTLERCFAKIKDGLRRVGDGKQPSRGLVDADIGGLSREDHGNEQFEWRGVDELGGGPGVVLAKTREELDDVFALHATEPTCRLPIGRHVWPCHGQWLPARRCG